MLGQPAFYYGVIAGAAVMYALAVAVVRRSNPMADPARRYTQRRDVI